ncbi:MAG: helix-turn-helix domain-containing protein [Bacteroidota bacterium]
MPVTVMTLEDFQNMKQEFLDEIRSTLKESIAAEPRKLLKSKEVLDLLRVSTGTLQTLRINGTLPFVKIGGVIYYDPEDINKMIEINKHRGYKQLGV